MASKKKPVAIASKAMRARPYPIFTRALEEALEKIDADIRDEEAFCEQAVKIILEEIHKVFDFNDQPSEKPLTAKTIELLGQVDEDVMSAVCEVFDFDD
jgi:hypothetical protein